MIAVAAFSGPRLGEILALRWRDAAFAEGFCTCASSSPAIGFRPI
jgi:integrase